MKETFKKPLKHIVDKKSYFYLTCNCCDRIIYDNEMTAEEYNTNGGYCPDCEQ